jgi:predicted RNA-binding Zn-ribbon protein involved in translation (DUF1610 family)
VTHRLSDSTDAILRFPAPKGAKQKSMEGTMKTTNIASTRRPDYGMTCAQCGDAMIAPEWSKFISKRRVVNFWSCTECGFCFEAVEFVPADLKAKVDSKSLSGEIIRDCIAFST